MVDSRAIAAAPVPPEGVGPAGALFYAEFERGGLGNGDVSSSPAIAPESGAQKNPVQPFATAGRARLA
jgi:hypothetical protein